MRGESDAIADIKSKVGSNYESKLITNVIFYKGLHSVVPRLALLQMSPVVATQ